MMKSRQRDFEDCTHAMRGALRTNTLRTRLAKKLTGKTDADIDAMAMGCIFLTTRKYDLGIKDVDILKDEVRKTAKQQYGSILVAILFAVIWEVIKRWLFD